MTRVVIYNQEMLDIVKQDLQKAFDENKRINLSYEKAHKEKTRPQVGFLFSALISNITDYFIGCGFILDEDDVRYKLYQDVSKIVPEMVVDRQIFGGEPRIKHIGEMNRELMSKFIDGIFTVIDTQPIYEGLMLHPSIKHNWLFHLEAEDILLAKNSELPERDEEYLEYIHNQPCVICGRQHQSHAHHAKIPRYVSNSKKTPDWTAVPLCQKHHLEGAHTEGHKWLLEKIKWLPVDLETFCRLNYLRWKNKLNN